MTKDAKLVAGYSTQTVSAADGLALFCRKWDPVTGRLASVVIVHGLGEHSGRYVHVGRYFAEAGFRVIAFDLRGHGRSAGRRVYVKNYLELASDVDCVVKYFRGDPSFLFGHSLGGQLVLWTAQHFQLKVAGLIVSAPWLALAYAPPRWQIFAARKLNALMPGFRFSTGISRKRCRATRRISTRSRTSICSTSFRPSGLILRRSTRRRKSWAYRYRLSSPLRLMGMPIR